MNYKIIDNDTGRELHSQFPRHGALLWAARWCDANDYREIKIDDQAYAILDSRGADDRV